jgi:hypothetical protein
MRLFNEDVYRALGLLVIVFLLDCFIVVGYIERSSRDIEQTQITRWVQTLNNLNWSALEVVRPLLQKDMKDAVKDKKWQEFCTEILGLTLSARYARLSEWLQLHDFDETSRIQVTSYVHLLRRGGLIK